MVLSHSKLLDYTSECTFCGREVLASALILNVPSRADWKNCSATRQEEEQDTQEMRKQFEPFDFTDDD